MTFWRHFLQRLGLSRSRRLTFRTDEALIQSLQSLARDERRSTEAVANDLLKHAVLRQQADRESLKTWSRLTVREQQVISLMCLNYTTAQIASRLGLSTETVKSHIQGGMRKYQVKSRSELRTILGDWDFSDWEGEE